MTVERTKKQVVPAALLLGLAFLVLLMGKSDKEKDVFAGKVTLESAFLEQAGEMVQERVQTCFLPILTFMRAGQPGWSRQAAGIGEEAFLPLTHFLKKAMLLTEDSFTIDRMILAESEEGVERQWEGQDEAFAEGDALEEDINVSNAELEKEGKGTEPREGEEAATESGVLIREEWENGGQGVEWSATEKTTDTGQQANAGNQGLDGGTGSGNGENSIYIPVETALLHTQKLKEIDWAEMADFDTLVKNMYTIDSSTEIGSDQLNVEKLGSVDLGIDKESSGYQILIYHTHSQEAFLDSRPGVEEDTIVGVGDYLADILRERYGYRVLHHYGVYDVPSRDDAYSVALPDVTRVLEENPSIQVVIDLHRDAVDAGTRLVTEINGKQTARFMFFNGLSRTRKRGNISYLYNENLDTNLAFSFQMEQKAMEYYPGLTRKIYLKAYRYNMHLRPRSLLVELGAQTNTLQEAKNACEPLAQMLDMVLAGE